MEILTQHKQKYKLEASNLSDKKIGESACLEHINGNSG
jgi:hypothetical protein